MTSELSREVIEAAFDRLGRYAAEQGLVIDIAVYGGSCLILASDIRNASADVDAVFLSHRGHVAALAKRVARDLNLPVNWLNEGVRRVAPPPNNPEPILHLFGDYPRSPSTGVGLRVHLPTPEYMLAMKILANRFDDDADKIQSDEQDAVALMSITGIATRESLTALLSRAID